MKRFLMLILLIFSSLLLGAGCNRIPTISQSQQGIVSYNLNTKQIEIIHKTDNTNYSKVEISPNGEKFLMIKKSSTPSNSIDYTIMLPDTNTTTDYTLKIPQTEGDIAPIIMSGELMTKWLDDGTLSNTAYNLIFNIDGTNPVVCQLPSNHMLTGFIQDLNFENKQFILVHAPKPQSSDIEMNYFGSWYDKKGKLLTTKNLNISGNTFMVNGNISKLGLLLNYAKPIDNKTELNVAFIDFSINELNNWAKDTTAIVLNPQGPLIAGIPYNPTTQLLGDEDQAIVAIYDTSGNKILGFKTPKELPLILFPEWLAWSNDGSAVYALINDYKQERSYLLKADTATRDQEYAELVLELPYICSPGGMDFNGNVYFLANPASNQVSE